MINRLQIQVILICILLVLITGCSRPSSAVNPVLPDDAENPVTVEIPNVTGPEMIGHELLGSWIMTFDLETHEVSIEPDRTSLGHLNVKWMIPPPSIMWNSFDPVDEILDVDVTIENPYAISGYDVRVIIYTDNFGHTLINADNWTKLYDIPGGSTMNPFKAYAKSEPNRLFSGQTSHTENMLIRMPGGNFNVNFAVDASYPTNCEEPYWIGNMIQEEVLYDRLDDEAAVHVSVNQWNPETYVTVKLICTEVFGANVIVLNSDDYEYFYGDVINYANAAAGEYTVIIQALSRSGGSLYSIDTIYVTEKETVGWARMYEGAAGISKIDTDTSGNVMIGVNAEGKVYSYTKEQVENWQLDILSMTFGGDIEDIYYEPTFDRGYLTSRNGLCGGGIISGLFGVSFDKELADPVQKEQLCDYVALTPNTITADQYGNLYNGGEIITGLRHEAVMWKLDSNMQSQFYIDYEQTDGSLEFSDLAFSGLDKVLALGKFWGTSVDLNPGAGFMNMIPQGQYDAFLTELTSGGVFSKLRVWGGSGDSDAEVYPYKMAIDSEDKILIAGSFEGAVDFDPATFDWDIKTSTGSYEDMFISRFTSALGYQDVICIGCDGYIAATGMDLDIYDNIYLCGTFMGTADFDPGTGVTNRSSGGQFAMFCAKYTKTYDLVWVQTWGNDEDCHGMDIAYDTVYNQVYFAGLYSGTMDFDPGEEVFEMTTAHLNTPFLMRMTSSSGLWEY